MANGLLIGRVGPVSGPRAAAQPAERIFLIFSA